MEIGTGLALFGSAQLAGKLLGPTAEYLGGGLKDWTARRVANTRHIFENAAKKLGPGLERPGAVSPKVLSSVISHGSYSEDELSADYFGGVLASSRSETSRDDRGAGYSELIGRLSSYQLRTHYILYEMLRRLFVGSGTTLQINDRPRLKVFIPFRTYEKSMDFAGEEEPHKTGLFEHAFFGLHRESLIENFVWGAPDVLKARHNFEAGDEGGIVYQPSVLGAELFLVAHGRRPTTAGEILESGIPLRLEYQLSIASGYRAVAAPPAAV